MASPQKEGRNPLADRRPHPRPRRPHRPASQRFRDEGCPNCEHFLHLQGSPEQIEACTSQVYEGIITVANPSKSWVARWQRIASYVRGVYAMKVSGQLPDDVKTTMEEEYGITYIP